MKRLIAITVTVLLIVSLLVFCRLYLKSVSYAYISMLTGCGECSEESREKFECFAEKFESDLPLLSCFVNGELCQTVADGIKACREMYNSENYEDLKSETDKLRIACEKLYSSDILNIDNVL